MGSMHFVEVHGCGVAEPSVIVKSAGTIGVDVGGAASYKAKMFLPTVGGDKVATAVAIDCLLGEAGHEDPAKVMAGVTVCSSDVLKQLPCDSVTVVQQGKGSKQRCFSGAGEFKNTGHHRGCNLMSTCLFELQRREEGLPQ